MPDLSSEFQLNLPRFVNTGDPRLDRAIQPIHDALNILAQYLDGINPQSALSAANTPINTLRKSGMNRMVVKALGNIAEGQPVYFTLNAGELKALPALATATFSLAMGFCSQPGGVATGAFGEFTPALGVAKTSGLTVGTKYFLQDAGGYGAGPGTALQFLGVALTTTDLLFILEAR